jgi:hypothetical protein
MHGDAMFKNNPQLNIFYDKKYDMTKVVTRETLIWDDGKDIIVVPNLFISDGASIPMPAWGIVGHPLSGQNIRCALLHDWECKTGQELKNSSTPYKYTWQEVHQRFYDALISEGVPQWRARLMKNTVFQRWVLDKSVVW